MMQKNNIKDAVFTAFKNKKRIQKSLFSRWNFREAVLISRQIKDDVQTIDSGSLV